MWFNFLVFFLFKIFVEIIYNYVNIFFLVLGVEKLEFYYLKLEYFYYVMDILMININVSKKVFLVFLECLVIRINDRKNF